MSKSRMPLAYLTAYMQISIGLIFMLGYFALLYCIFVGRPQIPDNLLELAKTLAIGLTNALGLLFAFLFLRSRTDGQPDPATTTIKQTTETETKPVVPAPQIDPPTEPQKDTP